MLRTQPRSTRPEQVAGRLLRAGLAAALLAVAAPGCDATPRHALEGTVTLDGQPLPDGYISFRPMAGTPGPTAGGRIVDGRFAISRQDGTFAGKFRVEITATRSTGEKFFDEEVGREVEILAQYLPARYNTQSELTAEVRPDGPNAFSFELTR